MPEYTKKIYYRKAVITNCKLTLQDLLTKALENSIVDDRKERPSESEKIYRWINKSKQYRGMFFCQFIQIERGANQNIISYEKNAKEFDVTSISPDQIKQIDNDNRDKDFIEEFTYFGVKDNKVVILPSKHLSFKALETHIAWLLGENKKLISDESSFIFSKRIPDDIIELIENHNIRTIEIGSPIIYSKNNEDIDEDEPIQSSGFKIIKNFFTKKDDIEDILENNNLKVKVIISSSKKIDQYGQKLLNQLGLTLRNLDDSDVKVALDGYGEISSDKLNIYKIIKISTVENNIIDENALYESMISWLLELANKNLGVIDD